MTSSININLACITFSQGWFPTLDKTVNLDIILTFYSKARNSTPFLISKGMYSTALNTYSWTFGEVFSLHPLLSALDRGVAGTASFCVSLAFDSDWKERMCAEICVSLWRREKLRKIAQSYWCLNKKGRLWVLSLSTWIVFLHPVCKKNSIYGCSESFDFVPAFLFCDCTS